MVKGIVFMSSAERLVGGRVGRVAGSPGSRGAKTWRPRGCGSLKKGLGRSLNPKTSITDLILGFEPNNSHLGMDFNSAFRESVAVIVFKRVYIHYLICSLILQSKINFKIPYF